MTDFDTIRRIIANKSKDRATLLRDLVAIQKWNGFWGVLNRPTRPVTTQQR